MRNYDLTPLYRSTVGFDRVFDLIDTMTKVDTNSYPPYNIERIAEDDYRIMLAVAGFAEEELDIEIHENTLTISGRRQEEETDRNFLHRGIAGRSFERRFQLADHVKIEGASLANGLLNIELRREIPEEKKPRKVAIGKAQTSNVKVLDTSSAA